MNCKMTFPERLKDLRTNGEFSINGIKKNKLTQKELSEELSKRGVDVSTSAIRSYEDTENPKEPGYLTFKALADFFNVTYDYLMCESDNKLRENINIGKRLGLTDKAISWLEYRQGTRIVVFDSQKYYTGAAAEKFLETEEVEADCICYDYGVQAINALIEDDAHIMRDIERFFFYQYQPDDASGNTSFNVKLRGGVHAFIDSYEINNIHFVEIQKKLLGIRDRIYKEEIENGKHSED